MTTDRQYGGRGCDLVTDSSAKSGFLIEAREETVIDEIIGYQGFDYSSWDGATLSEGEKLYGSFISVTLTSGSIKYYLS